MHQAGTLDEKIYESYLRFTAALLVATGGQAYLEHWRSVYNQEVTNELNKRIAKGDLGNIQQIPQFNIDGGSQNNSQ